MKLFFCSYTYISDLFVASYVVAENLFGDFAKFYQLLAIFGIDKISNVFD